jgi:hypothetical protein
MIKGRPLPFDLASMCRLRLEEADRVAYSRGPWNVGDEVDMVRHGNDQPGVPKVVFTHFFRRL